MNLTDYTTESGFLPKLKCASVEDAVAQLVTGVDGGPNADLVRDVMAREVDGSTAVGGGLVIPHARSPHTAELRVGVATLQQPLDIATEDERPVDIVILLVGPPGDPRQMLRVLARLARLVKRRGFLDTLRRAATAQELRVAFQAAVRSGG